MHFHALKPAVAPAAALEAIEEVPANRPEVAAPGPTPAAPSGAGRSVLGLLLPLLCLGVLALGLPSFSLVSMLFSGALALGLWAVAWRATYQKAGRSAVAGLVAAAIALCLMAAASALEVSLWLGL